MSDDPSALHIDDEDIEQLLNFLESNYEEIIADEAFTLMDASAELVRGEVAARTPVGVSGNLRGSIASSVIGRWPDFLQGQVSTPLPYGEIVEYGRKPGRQPPRDAIELWVRRKLGINEGAELAAILIARKIGKKGFPGAHMFRDATKAGRPLVKKLWREELIKRVVTRVEDQIGRIGRE